MGPFQMIELAKRLKNTLLPAVEAYGGGAAGEVLQPALEEIALYCEDQRAVALAKGFRRMSDTFGGA